MHACETPHGYFIISNVFWKSQFEIWYTKNIKRVIQWAMLYTQVPLTQLP
jgi:hypothetical protein